MIKGKIFNHNDEILLFVCVCVCFEKIQKTKSTFFYLTQTFYLLQSYFINAIAIIYIHIHVIGNACRMF